MGVGDWDWGDDEKFTLVDAAFVLGVTALIMGGAVVSIWVFFKVASWML